VLECGHSRLTGLVVRAQPGLRRPRCLTRRTDGRSDSGRPRPLWRASHRRRQHHQEGARARDSRRVVDLGSEVPARSSNSVSDGSGMRFAPNLRGWPETRRSREPTAGDITQLPVIVVSRSDSNVGPAALERGTSRGQACRGSLVPSSTGDGREIVRDNDSCARRRSLSAAWTKSRPSARADAWGLTVRKAACSRAGLAVRRRHGHRPAPRHVASAAGSEVGSVRSAPAEAADRRSPGRVELPWSPIGRPPGLVPIQIRIVLY
jgi:hypothetical protein